MEGVLEHALHRREAGGAGDEDHRLVAVLVQEEGAQRPLDAQFLALLHLDRGRDLLQLDLALLRRDDHLFELIGARCDCDGRNDAPGQAESQHPPDCARVETWTAPLHVLPPDLTPSRALLRAHGPAARHTAAVAHVPDLFPVNERLVVPIEGGHRGGMDLAPLRGTIVGKTRVGFHDLHTNARRPGLQPPAYQPPLPAPGGPIITSQLFFPGVPNNSEDGIFDPKMLLTVQETSDGLTATFDFVVKTK